MCLLSSWPVSALLSSFLGRSRMSAAAPGQSGWGGPFIADLPARPWHGSGKGQWHPWPALPSHELYLEEAKTREISPSSSCTGRRASAGTLLVCLKAWFFQSTSNRTWVQKADFSMYHRWPLLSSVVHEGWEPISLVMADLPDLSVRKMRFFFSFSTSTSSSVLNWVFAKCHRWAKNWDVDLTLSHREAHLTKFFPPPSYMFSQ